MGWKKESPALPGDDDKIELPFGKQKFSYSDVITEKIDALPPIKKAFFDHSWKGLSGLAVASGIIINSQMRKSVFLYEGLISSSAITSFGAVMASTLLRYGFIEQPLYEGKANCLSCVMIRSGIIQAFSGTIFPTAISLLTNALLADRYEAAKIPAMQWKYRHNWYKFWAPKLRSFRSLWYFSLLANCLFGAYVGKQQFDIAGEMYSSVTDEDYLELWNSIVNTYRFEKKSKSP